MGHLAGFFCQDRSDGAAGWRGVGVSGCRGFWLQVKWSDVVQLHINCQNCSDTKLNDNQQRSIWADFSFTRQRWRRGSASNHTHTYIFRGTQIPEVFLLYFLGCDWRSLAVSCCLLLSLAVERFGGTRCSSQCGEPGCHREVTTAVGVFNLEASSGNRRAVLMTVVISGQTSAASRL